MANTYGPPPTGQGWDEDSPSVGGSNGIRGNAGFEIRDLRIGLRIRLEKEHEDMATSGGGGEHLQGSAKIYAGDYSAAWPTTRPDGATALDSDDTGRLAIDTTSSPNRIAIYVDPDWIEIGELVGNKLLVRGDTTDYTTPIEIGINDDAAADPANEFRWAITAENTLKLQGRNAADNGWVDIFTWVRGTLAMTAGCAIAMGSNKITGLAAGTASGDALHAAQVDADTIELNGSNQLALKAGAATTGIKKTHLATDAGEFVDDTTIENDATNGLQVKDASITAAKMAVGAQFTARARPSVADASVAQAGAGTYDLDISALVGANSALVFYELLTTSGQNSAFSIFPKGGNGDGADRGGANSFTLVGAGLYTSGFCQTSSAGILSVKSAGAVYFEIRVLGYLK